MPKRTSDSSVRTEASDFAITSAEIINIGAIDYLDIKLCEETPPLDCLYATNGVGKTTLLEALSLVGHLPCMPLICLDREFPSLLRLVSGTTPEKTNPALTAALNGSAGNDRNLRDITDQLRRSLGRSVGAVRLSVVDPERADDPSRGSRTHSFMILVTSGHPGHTPTLTALLSRETQEGHPESDFSLEKHFAIFVNKRAADLASMREFVARLARGRTFTDDGEIHRPFRDFATKREFQDLVDGEKRKVSYVNTDLNDFGRGNDLRESPKNIEKSFLPEVIDRFGIAFSDGARGPYAGLEAVNANLRHILDSPINRFSDAYAISQTVQVSIFSRTDKGLDFEAYRGWGTPFAIQFLSAGENEVFFLLLMAYTMRAGEGVASILLLDEPDLHVAAPMRRPLFNTLLDIILGNLGQRQRPCSHPPRRPSQLIICSHSPVMIDVCRERALSLRQHVRVLYRCFEGDEAEKSRLVALHDARYLSRLHTDNLVSFRNPRAWLRRRIERISKAWYWWKGFWVSAKPGQSGASPVASILATMTIVLILYLAFSFVLAFINDTANVNQPKPFGLGPVTLFTIHPGNWVSELLGNGPLKFHDIVRDQAVQIGVGALLLAIVKSVQTWRRDMKRRELAAKAAKRRHSRGN